MQERPSPLFCTLFERCCSHPTRGPSHGGQSKNLTPEERQLADQIIFEERKRGRNPKIYSHGIVQLRVASNGRWEMRTTGVVCVLKDFDMRAFVVAVVDMDVSLRHVCCGSAWSYAWSTPPTRIRCLAVRSFFFFFLLLFFRSVSSFDFHCSTHGDDCCSKTAFISRSQLSFRDGC